MHRWLSLLTIGISMLLSACSLAPNYQRPEAPVPEEWPRGDAYSENQAKAETPATGELDWQDFVVDERLHQVIAMALGNNRDLRLAALNVERARAL